MLRTEVHENTLVVREISHIAKDKDQEIEKMDSRLAGKQLFTYDQLSSPLRVIFPDFISSWLRVEASRSCFISTIRSEESKTGQTK